MYATGAFGQLYFGSAGQSAPAGPVTHELVASFSAATDLTAANTTVKVLAADFSAATDFSAALVVITPLSADLSASFTMTAAAGGLHELTATFSANTDLGAVPIAIRELSFSGSASTDLTASTGPIIRVMTAPLSATFNLVAGTKQIHTNFAAFSITTNLGADLILSPNSLGFFGDYTGLSTNISTYLLDDPSAAYMPPVEP